MVEIREDQTQDMETPSEDGRAYVAIDHSFIDRFAGGAEKTFSFRFSRPSPTAVGRTQQMAGKKLPAAMRNLCVGCVHPDDKQKMLAAFDTYPGLPTTFGNALLEAAGIGDLGNG
ncbi:MAG: hypothetical protein SWH61_05290 [Thermodesulfobacteriota bacterium]|nr:hypothetical protein [Thermodesulfobacteriota bacterium]